jgi:hypothetical protein
MTGHARKLVTAAAVGAFLTVVSARVARAAGVGDVFMIEMENNDWTTPQGDSAGYVAIKGDTADAPFINSLLTTSAATNPAYGQVSYADQYHNDYDTNNTILAGNPGANDPNIHPSEPNYVWQEAASNLSLNNDNDPYGSGGSVATIASYLAGKPTNLNGTPAVGDHLTGLMQAKGLSWKSYQEGTNLLNSSGQAFDQNGGTLTNTVAGASQQTVPLSSFSGTSASYVNPYNGSHQYNFAAKHDGTLFFNDTNGGNNNTSTNTEASHYEALESLQTDLSNNTVGRYNLITPDQYNDMHSNLSGSYNFVYNGTTYNSSNGNNNDHEKIAQGDNFLSKIVPQIMSSQAYKNNGAIVIWCDETEGTYNDSTDTLMEIVISPLAKGSTTGTGVYEDTLNFDHSSDVATLQEIYQTPDANTASGYLNNASSALPGGAQDLSDLFVAGSIPTSVPEPTCVGLLGVAAAALLGRRRGNV